MEMEMLDPDSDSILMNPEPQRWFCGSGARSDRIGILLPDPDPYRYPFRPNAKINLTM